MLQLWVRLLEVLNQVVQRLQHVLNEADNLRGAPLRDAIQSPEGRAHLWSCGRGRDGGATARRAGALLLLDEVGEEEGGVADDPSGAGLLVLAALQDKAVIHVTLSMQAGLKKCIT